MAAGLRVPGGIRKEVGHDLRQPDGIAMDLQAIRRDLHSQMVPALLQQRARHFDPLGDRGGQLDRLLPDLDLAAGDAGDVEQIVQQACEVLHLALEDAHVALRHLAAHPEDLESRHDRRQGVAELVTEHGQELVLRAARGLRLDPRGFSLGEVLVALPLAAPQELCRALQGLSEARHLRHGRGLDLGMPAVSQCIRRGSRGLDPMGDSA
jgi:hypothetical protein